MAKKAETQEPQAGVWAPPTNAAPVELAEFVKWENKGDVVIGRITDYRERPDDTKPGKIMRSVILSPVIVMERGERATAKAYHSLALGLSAHLGLLLPNAKDETGAAYAFRYDEDRAPAVRGQKASRQFSVYKLTEAEFRAEVGKVATDDDLPF